MSPRRTDAYVLSFERFEFLLNKIEKRIKNNKKSATFTKIIRKRIKNEGKKEDKIRSNLGYFYEVNILTARENPKVIPKYQKIPSFLAVKLINSMGENPCNLSITRISKIKRNKVQMVFILEKRTNITRFWDLILGIRQIL